MSMGDTARDRAEKAVLEASFYSDSLDRETRQIHAVTKQIYGAAMEQIVRCADFIEDYPVMHGLPDEGNHEEAFAHAAEFLRTLLPTVRDCKRCKTCTGRCGFRLTTLDGQPTLERYMLELVRVVSSKPPFPVLDVDTQDADVGHGLADLVLCGMAEEMPPWHISAAVEPAIMRAITTKTQQTVEFTAELSGHVRDFRLVIRPGASSDFVMIYRYTKVAEPVTI
jgi:hypothetical protein